MFFSQNHVRFFGTDAFKHIMLQRSTHDLNSKVEGGDGYSPGCKTVNTISDLATRVCSLNGKCAALGNISQSNPCFEIIALDALTHTLARTRTFECFMHVCVSKSLYTNNTDADVQEQFVLPDNTSINSVLVCRV